MMNAKNIQMYFKIKWKLGLTIDGVWWHLLRQFRVVGRPEVKGSIYRTLTVIEYAWPFNVMMVCGRKKPQNDNLTSINELNLNFKFASFLGKKFFRNSGFYGILLLLILAWYWSLNWWQKLWDLYWKNYGVY